MKKIAIYCFVPDVNFKWDENNYNTGKIGSSEIWAIKLSEEFVKRGYEVYVFGNPNIEHKSENGVLYFYTSSFKGMCEQTSFDYVILSRTLNPLNDIKNCDNIYLMCHDTNIIGNFDLNNLNRINKIFCQSKFQYEILKKKYGFLDNKMAMTFDGVDHALYDENKDIEKKNKTVLSSGFGKGVRFFIENIFPKIKKEVPDFEVDICSYSNNISALKQDGINLLGNISKDDLTKRQCESKIWIYPNHGYDYEFNRNEETFSISAIENAYAKNACIIGKWGCFASIFDGYDYFVGNDLYDSEFEPMEYDNVEQFYDEVAKEAVKCLTNEEYRRSLAESSYECVKKYTWENAVDTFENVFNDAKKTAMIYVITHKDFPYLKRDDLHQVLQVGTEINGNLNIGLCDNVGENISNKNPFYLELTGIYWAWKNSKRYDYIGTQAYRRDFNLSKDEIVKILSDNDVIASPIKFGESVYDQYRNCHIIEDLDSCSMIIDEMYPEYRGKFDKFAKKETKLYIGCGCITSYETYDKINSFIFNILFEFEKRSGILDYNGWLEHAKKSGQTSIPKDHEKRGVKPYEYQSRLFGFLYERLFTFFIYANNLRVYEKEYVRLDKEYDKMSMKILLCCIGRLENRYIREFVEYYKMLGFSNICLYDNNRDGEENFNDAIGDYINNGYVILKDYRNITTPCQLMAYNECYAEYGKEYDWIAFLDIDEFIFLNRHANIKDYLMDSIFDDFDMIHMNWLMFGDGGMVYDNGLPLLMRIKTPLDVNMTSGYDIPDTFHIKSIVRGGLNKITFSTNPHTPNDNIRCCNSFGIPCAPDSPFVPYDFRNGGILHFTTKTAEEYAKKVNRGFCDGNPNTKQSLIELFFKRNEITKEKVDLFKERVGVDVSYLLPYDGEKRKDVQIFSLCYSRKDFKFLDDSVVTPLQVGASNGLNVCNLKDNTNDNISDKNYFFIESTGTYWIWKNIHDAKYKGQMQYRRPLDGVNETMNFEDVFNKYDVITCKPFNHPENSVPTKEQPMCIPAKTVEEGYKFSNCIDDLYILELAIKHYHPDYAEDYDKYIKNGENLYYSNGFIMKSEDFDRYCEFLFDCLNHYLDLAGIHSKEELIDHVKYNLETGKYIRYEKPEEINENAVKWQTEIGGFLSERIWTLWLQHNFSHDRIYELPYIKMEDNMYT